MNNTITASRMNTLLMCHRKHYWQCEVGLRSDDISLALRFGSAWARAMEAYWRGKIYDDALNYALPQDVQLDKYEFAKVAALLGGYYSIYGPSKKYGKLYPERQFGPTDIADGFNAQGKLDGIGVNVKNQSIIIEAKTTSDSIEADSQYWVRLVFNMQLYQYYIAALEAGWNVVKVIYDVTKKPSIRPKEVADLDENGLKIVVDAKGERVYGKDKTKPRQMGDDSLGYVVKKHVETPDEYFERLCADVEERPEFYFKRKEVPIFESDVEKFCNQRLAIIGLIKSMRQNESLFKNPAEAWPRNVGHNTCMGCEYKSFCLSNFDASIDNLPKGFSIKPLNQELVKVTEEETT